MSQDHLRAPRNEATPTRTLYIYSYASEDSTRIDLPACLHDTLIRNHPQHNTVEAIVNCFDNIPLPTRGTPLQTKDGLRGSALEFQRYVMRDRATMALVMLTVDAIEERLVAREGESFLALVRCNDGRGVSVAVAEILARTVRGGHKDIRIVVRHTEARNQGRAE
jgi:hypothetical protein